MGTFSPTCNYHRLSCPAVAWSLSLLFFPVDICYLSFVSLLLWRLELCLCSFSCYPRDAFRIFVLIQWSSPELGRCHSCIESVSVGFTHTLPCPFTVLCIWESDAILFLTKGTLVPFDEGILVALSQLLSETAFLVPPPDWISIVRVQF